MTAEALRLVLDLRSKATSIDGWCSSCSQIDKHKEWCPWTRLVFLVGGPADGVIGPGNDEDQHSEGQK